MSENKIIFLDFLIRHAWHRVSRMYNQKAIMHGTTMSVGFILMIVEKSGTLSTQLGPKMGMESTSLSRVLKSMEAQGLIHKVSDPNDKRSVVIRLTDAGISKRNIARQVVLDFNQSISERIGEKRTQEFISTMTEIGLIISAQK